jgi:hypothetical protein
MKSKTSRTFKRINKVNEEKQKVVSFEVDELSQEDQDKILAVLNDHFDETRYCRVG